MGAFFHIDFMKCLHILQNYSSGSPFDAFMFPDYFEPFSRQLYDSIHYSFSLAAMFPIVAREEWGAREPKLVERFSGPIPFVIIHHSYIPSACFTEEACKLAMRKMQDMHQLKNGWNDIGYSFAVGGDGRIYKGRGFNVVGAHAPRYNNKSIGICLIGDWTSN